MSPLLLPLGWVAFNHLSIPDLAPTMISYMAKQNEQAGDAFFLEMTNQTAHFLTT
jgi:hypothetical protein